MRDKRMVTVPIMLIVVLSMVGFAYATWWDYVQIETTVNMGSLTIGLTELTCVEKHIDPATGLKADGEWLGKDVGKVECEMRELIEDKHTGKVGYKVAFVKITNAYPSYQVHIIFAVKNLGKIPVHFVEITAEDPTGELIWDEAQMCFWKDFDGDGLKDPDEIIINVDVVNLICVQLDFCEDTKAQIDLHFKEAAEECHIYKLKFTVIAVQWNKA